MNIRKTALLLLLLVAGVVTAQQKNITLEEIYDGTGKNMPFSIQTEIQEQKHLMFIAIKREKRSIL